MQKRIAKINDIVITKLIQIARIMEDVQPRLVCRANLEKRLRRNSSGLGRNWECGLSGPTGTDCPRPEERADAELKRAEANRAIAGERLQAGANTARLSGMDEMLDA